MAKVLIPRSDSVSVKVIEPSDFESMFSDDIINDYVKSGFTLTAGSGLAVNIAVGKARLKGLFIHNDSASSKSSLTASNTNYIYVTLARDSNSEAESWDFTSNTTGSTPTDSLFIGTATTNGSSVTAVDMGNVITVGKSELEISASKVTSDNLSVTRGGTGVSNPTTGKILVGAGSSAMTQVNKPSLTVGTEVNAENGSLSTGQSGQLGYDDFRGMQVTFPTTSMFWKVNFIEFKTKNTNTGYLGACIMNGKSGGMGNKVWQEDPVASHVISNTDTVYKFAIDAPYFHGGQTIMVGVINMKSVGGQNNIQYLTTASSGSSYEVTFSSLLDNTFSGLSADSTTTWFKVYYSPVGEF